MNVLAVSSAPLTANKYAGSMKAMKRGCMWSQFLRRTSRWAAVLLAAFYLNFVTVHLATEMHFHHGEEHHAQEHEQDHQHEHEGNGHAPHDASEHLLDVALKGGDPALAGPVLAIASEDFILHRPTPFTGTQHVFERERPPGESPPDPQQPRAPPLA
jgi:hypothetical protein